MALPDFTSSAGLALIRRYVPTGEEFLVGWLRPYVDFTLDLPGPGPWVYEVWLINGASSPSAEVMYGPSPGTGAPASMAIIQLKR